MKAKRILVSLVILMILLINLSISTFAADDLGPINPPSVQTKYHTN